MRKFREKLNKRSTPPLGGRRRGRFPRAVPSDVPQVTSSEANERSRRPNKLWSCRGNEIPTGRAGRYACAVTRTKRPARVTIFSLLSFNEGAIDDLGDDSVHATVAQGFILVSGVEETPCVTRAGLSGGVASVKDPVKEPRQAAHSSTPHFTTSESVHVRHPNIRCASRTTRPRGGRTTSNAGFHSHRCPTPQSIQRHAYSQLSVNGMRKTTRANGPTFRERCIFETTTMVHSL